MKRGGRRRMDVAAAAVAVAMGLAACGGGSDLPGMDAFPGGDDVADPAGQDDLPAVEDADGNRDLGIEDPGTTDPGTGTDDVVVVTDEGPRDTPAVDPGVGQDPGAATDTPVPADPGAVDPGATDPGPTDPGAADVSELPKFSFFVTSLVAMQQVSGNPNGFGGDLRFGETGANAGLRGADKICAAIAERSLPGAGAKPWRAFLSATDDGAGNVVNAIDRIGDGPWYDRLGRVFALQKADLLYDRPSSANATIKNDFPNEDGVPNHQPDPTKPQVDNHDFLTGTNDQGKLYGTTATCKDWTTSVASTSNGKPRVGHSWPRSGPGGGGGGPGGQDMANWMSALDEGGCGAGINLVDQGGPLPGVYTVGTGGGYGGIYCFSLVP